MATLTKEQMMEAVSEGIRRGIWDVATNQDPRLDLPNELLFDAVRQGIQNAMDFPKYKLLEVFQEGVYNAMWQLMTNDTQMPCADFYKSVEEGVRAAMEKVGRRAED